MTLTTAKGKAASTRWSMARLDVAYYPFGWFLVSTPPHVYYFNWGYFIGATAPRRLAVGGVDYTEVSSLGALTGSNKWFYDAATGYLYVLWPILSTPNAADTSNGALVVYYYLYYTTGETRYAPSTPTGAGALVEYEPRILEYTPVAQSFENGLSGVVTISDFSLTLANDDGALSRHFSGNHSYATGAVDFWLFIDSLSNGQQVYRGNVASISATNSNAQITLSVLDSFSRLNQPCLMGDPQNQAYLTNDGTLVNVNITALAPNAEGKPCPYVAGRYSYVDYVPYTTASLPMVYYVRGGNEAKCINYTATKSTTTNRNWRLCRIGSTAMRSQSIGSVSSAFSDTGGIIWHVNFASHNLIPGEWIVWTNAGTREALVIRSQSYTYAGNPYNCTLYAYAGAVPTPAAPSTIVPGNRPIIVVKNTSYGFSYGSTLLSDLGYSQPPSAYTLSLTPTDGGNTVVDLLLNNTLAFTESAGDPLDPDYDYVYYVALPDSTPGTTHGAVAKRIVEKSGMTALASTFTAADATLPLNVVMDTPRVGESDYETYREYLQAIATSAAAYVRINNSMEVEYNLLTAAGSGDVSNTDIVLRDSVSADIEFQDLETTLLGENDHIPDWQPLMTGDNPNERADSYKGRFLNGVNKAVKLNHVLESITDRISFILDLRKTARRTYNWTTDTEHIDKLLGDNVTLIGPAVLNATGTVNVKIVGVEKSDKETRVTAVEI